MDFAVLQAVRDRFQGYTPLLDYFAQHYPYSTLRFFVGLKPSPKDGTAMPTDLFPYIAIGPWRLKTEANPGKNVDNMLSIMFGIDDDREDNGVFLGVKSICDISQLILKGLDMQPITPGKVFNGETEILFDAGALHPYYEAELMPVIETRKF